jgi:hypothetical protein
MWPVHAGLMPASYTATLLDDIPARPPTEPSDKKGNPDVDYDRA